MFRTNLKPAALVLLYLPTLLTARPVAAQEHEALQPDEFLALHRLELRPYGGWAAVPNSVTGAFIGADTTFRLNRFFALGADLAWYGPFGTSAGERPAYPLNETLWSAGLDANLVPWPARARPGAAAGSFEPYLIGGLGAISTRPVPVVDPANRRFDASNNLIDFCVGLGARVFVAERVALTFELRDLIYPEKIESAFVSRSPQDPSAWSDTHSHITNAIQLRLGASFFVAGR
jgi:hypothetical protein